MHIRLLPALMTAFVLVLESLALRSTVRPAPQPSLAAQPAPDDLTAVSASHQPAALPGRESVAVESEIVTARLVQSPPPVAGRLARSSARQPPAPVQKRSLFARVVLGNGDSRPQPFPRPGS